MVAGTEKGRIVAEKGWAWETKKGVMGEFEEKEGEGEG